MKRKPNSAERRKIDRLIENILGSTGIFERERSLPHAQYAAACDESSAAQRQCNDQDLDHEDRPPYYYPIR
jgi:hypothetical protein